VPELRKDPITARWVIISTERGRRPMDFVRESVVVTGPRGCPFCPGAENKTAGNSGLRTKWRRGEYVGMEYSRCAESLSSAGD